MFQSKTKKTMANLVQDKIPHQLVFYEGCPIKFLEI